MSQQRSISKGMRLAPPADLLRDDPELAVVEPSRCSSSPVSVKADA